jgi:hypothetical protein
MKESSLFWTTLILIIYPYGIVHTVEPPSKTVGLIKGKGSAPTQQQDKKLYQNYQTKMVTVL